MREYLVQSLGVPAEAVAVKSSEMDELRGKDLLSAFSPVRWIITKAALMEGWDCPFAYVLVMLDNTRAQRALTQLVGRVHAPAPRPGGQAGNRSTSATSTAPTLTLARPLGRSRTAWSRKG